ncbi:adenylate and guanylate cyclase catalytic domain-containing protein [Ditylenchus destructor]|uniref:Guanylate cyclase n=1 Tax=Ditylenchus destructor TaxID=166010 RepID=A0AAD4R272_9BILA|nr:adenylate and guanylate cyclase catalytic domain-containing protein [Ditylenchus destructor]
MIMPRNESLTGSFSTSASAVALALERIYKEELLPRGTNISFSFLWRFDECIESTAIGYAFELIDKQKIDVLIAPPCIDGALVASHVATYYNIPVILWGACFDSRFLKAETFPTLMSVVTNYFDLSTSICSAMEFFDWNVFALIYQVSDNGICGSFQKDLERVSNSKNNCLISYKQSIENWKDESIEATLAQIKANARIVVLCFDDNVQLRRFAIKLSDADMVNSDYVYFIPRLRREWARMPNGTLDVDIRNYALRATPWWLDTQVPGDGRDADASKITQFSYRIQQDRRSEFVDTFPNFTSEVMARMKSWPFYCPECNHGQPASPYASTLYDAMYLYGLALSRVINQSGSANIRNGQMITKSSNLTFKGLGGSITIGSDGVTNAKFILSTFDDVIGNMKPQLTFSSFTQSESTMKNVTWAENASASTIWKTRNGIQPVSTPLCGFDGKGCPVDFFQAYKGYWITAIIIGSFVIAGIFTGIYYVIRLRKEEVERQNRLWRIPYSTLTKALDSMHSLKSNTASTSSSRFTFDSVKSIAYGEIYIMTGGEKVVAIMHNGAGVRLEPKDMAELRAMRNLDHDNLNRFIGLSIDGPQVMSLWRYCSRGPLSEVIMGNTTLQLDGFFIYSLIRDVCEGVLFLHNSPIGSHGNLRSTNCLIDDRWQVKLSDFGLKFFKAVEVKEAKDLLWTAPELIRSNNNVGTKEGDVFSFAVTCAEVINMKSIWEASDAKGNAEEVVYMLKKGGRQPFRPRIEPATSDLSPALTHLIKDCWNENPTDRPKMATVRSLLSSMNTAKSSNLMDHVFNLLEQYAGSLEEEINERTKQLVEEKKKSDILLYRMLPKQVAEKLKLGQAIDPETFDSVTVFFSDVVSFTTLASKCTPLQVVNLLNNLYTTLDSIIGEFDVYKVETIGDGYLCVSGLPHRNGNEHARHVANMSLAIMRSLVHFTISHLPGEKLKMRIGLHTGPCVAGVVGLSMPRYCLFGDTVNTASRMESNSKPMMIHLSASTNHCLTNVLGGFVTQSRGEVIIKGKGVMETFWLLGVEGDPHLPKEVNLPKDLLNETDVAQTPPVPEFTVRRHGNDTQQGSTRRDSSGIPYNKWL